MTMSCNLNEREIPQLKKSLIPGYKLKTHRLSHVAPFMSPKHLKDSLERNDLKIKRQDCRINQHTPDEDESEHDH